MSENDDEEFFDADGESSDDYTDADYIDKLDKMMHSDPPPNDHYRSNVSAAATEIDQKDGNVTEEVTRTTTEEEDTLKARETEESNCSSEELQERFEKSQHLKEIGNKDYAAKQYSEGIKSYSEGLDICPLKHAKERAILFSNRSQCLIKQEKNEEALADCDCALSLHPDYVKCLQRRADLRRTLEKLPDALEDYTKLCQLDPSNGQARYYCETLPRDIHEQQEKMKTEMVGQLKQLANMVLKPFGMSTNNFQVTQDESTGGYSVNYKS